MDQPMGRDQAREKIFALIRDVDVCMMTTVDQDGSLRSRPMSSNGEIDPDGTLWFFAYGHSAKVAEFEREPEVNLGFAKPGRQIYVSVSGRARLVTDRAELQRLWKPTLKAWFPKGLEEPDIALIRVSPETAEFWEGPGTIATAVALVTALATGKPADPGKHAKVTL